MVNSPWRLRCAATVGVMALAACTVQFRAAADPLPERPGIVLEVSELTPAQLPDGAGSGYLISYTTHDEHNNPATAAGQIYLPAGSAPPDGWPVVSWAKGTAGIGSVCSTATALRSGRARPPADAMAQPFLDLALRMGQAVVTSDYIGLDGHRAHHYLNPASAAHAVIDMVRAAHAVTPMLSTRWVAVGHSQGGQAALAADALAPGYAPELDLRGAVAFAPASNTAKIVDALALRPPPLPALTGWTPNLVYILAGLRDAQPEARVDDYLSAAGRRLVDEAPAECILDLRASLAGMSPQNLFSRPLPSEFVRAAHQYLDMPATPIRLPSRIAHGTADPIVPIAASIALTAEATATGATVHLAPYPGASHDDIVAVAAADAQQSIAAMIR